MTKQRNRYVAYTAQSVAKWLCGALALTIVIIAGLAVTAPAAYAQESKTAGGLTVYLGVLPADLVKGPGPHSAEPPMHGGAPRGRHEYHIIAAVYDATSKARISDATVTAKVSPLGLAGTQKTLEPMKIADTTTYGAYFNLTPDLYKIRLTVQRSGSEPTVFDFRYDHRR